MRVYVPRAFVSFLVLRTDNRTMIIDVLGAWISTVLTTVASRVQLAPPARSLCVLIGYNLDESMLATPRTDNELLSLMCPNC